MLIAVKLRFLTILLFIGGVAFAKPPENSGSTQLYFGIDQFTKALSYYSKEFTSPRTEETFSKHLTHLKKRQVKYKNEQSFAEYAFYYIHHRLLKEYKEYASLDQTLQKGDYDCVTATAMYALFFSELDVPFTVVETNYHLYILVFPGSEYEVLVETTDPFDGFVSNRKEVEKRKELYAKGNEEIRANQVDLKWDVQNNLKGSELIGLLLFNQSVKYYNLGNKKKAVEFANEALTYYPSPRIRTYVQFLKGNSLASR